MKKITLFTFAIIAFSFASCKKEYSCQCIKSGSVTVNTTVSAKSSSNAKSECSNYDSSTNGTCSIK